MGLLYLLSFITPDAYIKNEGIYFLADILKRIIFKNERVLLILYHSNNIGILYYIYIYIVTFLY